MRRLTLPEGYDIKVVVRDTDSESGLSCAYFDLYLLNTGNEDVMYIGEFKWLLSAIDAAWSHYQTNK
jgi:hypothetical protein